MMGSITPYQRLLEFQQLADPRVSNAVQTQPQDYPSVLERIERGLVRNWKPIAILAGVGLAMGLVLGLFQTPVYRAKAVFELQVPAGEKSESYLQTQLRLLDSDGLLWTAAVKSGLVETPEYVSLSRAAKMETLRRNLNVALSGSTRIVTVDFEAQDGAFASSFANEMVLSYRSLMRGRHLAASRQTLAFLENQAAEHKARTDAAQVRLNDFLKTQRLQAGDTLESRLRAAKAALAKAEVNHPLSETSIQREAVLREQVGRLTYLHSQYQILRQELEQNRLAYHDANRRQQEAAANAGVLADHLSILDAAHQPEEPARPNKALFTLFGLCGGLLVGLVVAFERETRANKIEAQAKASATLGVPQLGVAPPAWIDAPKSEPKHLAVAESRERYALWNFHNPGSAHAEAYRDIVTSLMFASERSHDGHLRVVVTSANSGEGRTTAAVNLATGIAETGCRVLLIDGNRGKQALHEIFDAPDTTGFFQAVALQDGLTAPVFASDVSNLFVMPAGPFNNALLDVAALRKVLEDVRETYDVILIDAPPVLGHADARWFSRVCDGAVLVHDPRISTARDAQAALARLQNDGIHVFGTLLNQWSPSCALVRANNVIPEVRIRLRITS